MVRGDVTLLVDMPAVRPGRLARGLASRDLSEEIRALREHLRGARCAQIDDGIRLDFALDVEALAAFAELVRAEADTLPFFTFRLLADPPRCRLEVTGTGPAAAAASAMFREIAAA
jgi:hypothetical protein